MLLLALHALGELAQELVHRLPELVGQALDLLVGGAALERLAQPLLGGAQLALGVGEVAVLDLERHRPEPFGDLEEVGVALCRAQALGGDAQAHEHAPLRREALRLDEERVERRLDAPAVVGIEHDRAPLLDERAGERLGEGPLRQREIDRLAASLLLGLVLGDEGQLHPARRPRDAG